ncbi:NAD-dependent epimerase/dehydratase family protein [Chelativorans salis]|uniref:NAD-dependent epimerase/dehydratase family protein n=1 Tax=Chelativorans salis TaxID=2978478 RepID=A0ABT2LV79_9HYPH|nr:NAD-dependent epimerase/dehydratase family protein [Chelativorans sp. EGI FJ00035]MCT7377268.1 NAD-dependent epimerase/dehydratase family protein [Chelativorans sp. EGI FJ00035]
MAKVLVTGASGFIGRHLAPLLAARGHDVAEAGRRPRAGARRFFAVGEINAATDWQAALAGVDAVVHLAGVAHREDACEAEYFAINEAGTGRLVEACAAAGVHAVVFVSSIAAREGANAYGLSKRAGEAHVQRFAAMDGKTGIALRPPLAYGHDAPGNWQRLQRLAATGVPLPFGLVSNHRSLCSVGNLCDAIAVAAEAGLLGIGSGVYEVADREQVSLCEMLTLLRAGMGRPRRLLPVPPGLLRLAARASGRRKLAAALLDDLTLDPSDFMRTFEWNPPETAQDAILQSGQSYVKQSRPHGELVEP